MNFDKAGVKREVSLKSCCVRDRGLSLPSTGVRINFHQASGNRTRWGPLQIRDFCCANEKTASLSSALAKLTRWHHLYPVVTLSFASVSGDFSKRVYQGVRVKHTVKDLLAEKRSRQTSSSRLGVSPDSIPSEVLQV